MQYMLLAMTCFARSTKLTAPFRLSSRIRGPLKPRSNRSEAILPAGRGEGDQRPAKKGLKRG